MPDQHRAFFAQLPFVLIGSVDQSGQSWASLLANPPGFISSPDAQTLRISAMPQGSDPLYHSLVPGASIAVLGIEQHTRRRNRMNGVVTAVNPSDFVITVHQSFGNCPKYIQARQVRYQKREAVTQARYHNSLDLELCRTIEQADTCFIASSHPQAVHGPQSMHGEGAAQGVDVSHRGGKPGFVKIIDNNTLLMPDYSGNRMFNTLGNLSLNPLAGLLFIDFDSGDLVQLAVRAEIIVDAQQIRDFNGAERLLKLHITRILHTYAGAHLHWESDVQYSPYLGQL
ncbi:MAG: pyridoxamine 5'-phosphate oxidase family protein [Gammaproteobacteria bacterium]|nr:pyridoxamine 5'-phosphate oxidase family protein [Gammaproteobacteria bacterium]